MKKLNIMIPSKRKKFPKLRSKNQLEIFGEGFNWYNMPSIINKRPKKKGGISVRVGTAWFICNLKK